MAYVQVRNSWSYICVSVNLFNCEIIGYNASKNKGTVLIEKAFPHVNVNLEKIQIFHVDRGNEFKNRLLDKTLVAFHIQRSLSIKGCSYNNMVMEATFKVIKIEFEKSHE